MNNFCEVKINDKTYGVLFGVRLYEVISEQTKTNPAFKISEDGKSSMDGICTVYAGIKNNSDFENKELDLTLKDLVIWADNNVEEYKKALDCLSKSKILGKPIEETAEEVKKKTRKRSMFGRLFQRIASAN